MSNENAKQGNSAQPETANYMPYRVGHVIDQVIAKMPEGVALEIIEQLADEKSQRVLEVLGQAIVASACEVFLSEFQNREYIERVRVQSLAIASAMDAMNRHGRQFAEGSHPLLNKESATAEPDMNTAVG